MQSPPIYTSHIKHQIIDKFAVWQAFSLLRFATLIHVLLLYFTLRRHPSQVVRAFDCGAEDCRFKLCSDHQKKNSIHPTENGYPLGEVTANKSRGSYAVAKDTVSSNAHHPYGCKAKGHLYLYTSNRNRNTCTLLWSALISTILEEYLLQHFANKSSLSETSSNRSTARSLK